MDMKQRRRIYYSAAQRSEIWDRWQGELAISEQAMRELRELFAKLATAIARSET
jgi:hypothetical protein